MSPVPVCHGARVTMQQFINGNIGTTPIYTQSGNARDNSPPMANTTATGIGHPKPVRPPNSQEIQQQLQQQLQTMQTNLQPNWLCENNAEPPPPYPMGTAAVTANPPPSYSQSMTMRQSPTLSMSSTSSEYRRSPAPPLPTNQYHLASSVNPYSNHQFGNPQILNNGLSTATNSTTSQPAIASVTSVVQQGQFISVQSPLPTSPSPSVMSSYSGTSSSMYSHGLATRKVSTHSPVIMQSVKSTQVQKPVLQTATGVATINTGVSDTAQQQHPQQIMVQSQAVMATPATGVVHHGIATSVAVPLSQQQQTNLLQQQQQILNSNNVNGAGGKITPIGTHISDGVATPPPPSYEFSMQQKQQQQRTSPVVGPRHQMHMPSPVTASRVIQQSPATVDKGVAQSLPPPPPYPSTAVSMNNNQCQDINNSATHQLVNGISVSAKQVPVVISTAKVVGTAHPTSNSSNANLVRTIETKHSVLQRKYSPLTSETGSSTAASRSESPISDSHTVSAASPLSFASSTGVSNNVINTTLCNMNNNVTGYELNASMAAGPQDAGVEPFSSLPPILSSNPAPGGMGPPPSSASLSMPQPPPYRPTHHVSPKPERKTISMAKEEAGKQSLIRSCPPQAFKFFMEQHIENVIKEYEKRRDRRMRLERELEQIRTSMQINEETKEKMRMALTRKETNYLRMRRAKLNKSHFKKIKDIGVGAFGKVSLVRSVYCAGQNRPGGLYAMKTLKKNQVLAKNQVAHVWSEKDILSEADNDWIVKLYYSFQVRI